MALPWGHGPAHSRGVLHRDGRPERLLTTVLFTDIVGSTERAAELGDRGWKDLVARHHAIVRRELKRFHGRELDTAGDGFFAIFDRPALAIECATAVIDDLRPLHLHIRAGVHMGEAEVMDGKVGGITVHVASRSMAEAGADEILVTSTVHDVAAGADVSFDDRGVRSFKGVPGEWHLYAVRWQRRELPAVDAVEPAGGGAGRRRIVWPIAAGAAVLGAGLLAVAGYAFMGRPPSSTPTPQAPQPNSALRIDATTNTVAATVAAGESPTGVAIDDEAVWVISLGSKTLTSVPLAGGAASYPVALPGTPTGIAAGNGLVWISFAYGGKGESAGVIPWSAVTRQRGDAIAIGSGAGAIVLDGNVLWVASEVADSVLQVDPQTRAIARAVSVGKRPVALASGGGSLWVANAASDTVSRVDLATLTPTEIPLGAGNHPTAVAAGFGKVWVASEVANTLTVFDATTNARVDTIALDEGPRGVAAGPDAIWVACARNVLARIDPASRQVVARIQLPAPAHGVAVAGSAVWVTVQQ